MEIKADIWYLLHKVDFVNYTHISFQVKSDIGTLGHKEIDIN